MDINVKDNMVTLETNYSYKPLSYRESNMERNDVLIRPQIYSADAAYDRLKLLRKTMKDWRNTLTDLDRRDMPSSLIERYEKVWAEMRSIELEEANIVKIGE